MNSCSFQPLDRLARTLSASSTRLVFFRHSKKNIEYHRIMFDVIYICVFHWVFHGFLQRSDQCSMIYARRNQSHRTLCCRIKHGRSGRPELLLHNMKVLESLATECLREYLSDILRICSFGSFSSSIHHHESSLDVKKIRE